MHTPHPQITSSQPATSRESDKLPVSPPVGVLAVVIIYFGAMMLGQFLLGIYPALAGWSSARADHWLSGNPTAQFLFVVIVEAMTLWMLGLFMRARRITVRMIGLLRPRLHDLWVTLLAYPVYFLINAAAVLGATAIFHFDTNQQQEIGFKSVNTPIELAMTFVSLVILPPIVEEIVMRGFLFGSLKNGMRVIWAALLTSVIFAIAHLQFGSGAPLLWTAAIDTFVLSMVLCYLRQRTGSLWPGIGLHALKNCLAFMAIFIFPHFHYAL